MRREYFKGRFGEIKTISCLFLNDGKVKGVRRSRERDKKKKKKRPRFSGALFYPYTGAWAILAAFFRIKTFVISAATEAIKMKGIIMIQSLTDKKVVSKNGRRKGT